MKKDKQNLISFAALIIALALLITAVTLFNMTVEDELGASALKALSEIIDQQQFSINRELEVDRHIVDNISKTIGVIGYDVEAILSYMQQVEKAFSFETIIFTDMNGLGTHSSGVTVNLSESEHWKRAINGETVTTPPYISESSGTSVIAIFSPILYEGNYDGVVTSEYTVEYLESLLRDSNESGYSLLIDSSGQIIASSTDDYVSFHDNANTNYIGDTDIDKMSDDISNGLGGTIHYIINGVSYVGEYRPLDFSGWSMLSVLTEAEISESVEAISKDVIGVSNLIVTFVIIFVSYILYLKNKNYKEIESVLYYDELTGLRNLVKFKIDAGNALEKNPDAKFVIAKMDMVNFKALNELYDFETGNEVLKMVAATSKNVTDSSFIMARSGADEFLMFAEGALLDNLEHSSMRYEALFRGMLPLLSKHQFSFRYGRYRISPGETNINDIISKVTIAHRFSKLENGPPIRDYDDHLKEIILKETQITNKMEKALANREFKVFMQPKFSIKDNSISGAEALVRWIEADGSMIFPNDFIPLFEKNGFILNLDMYMLEEVCIAIKNWLANGHKVVPISVNFSRLHLNQDDFVNGLVEICEKHQTPKQLIEVELTETAISSDKEALDKLLGQLRIAGFSVSIDDFGAGYSSLGMLKNFKVNTLKLDRSFFTDSQDGRGNIVVDGIIDIAHSLNMYTVAEGIETAEQVEFLKSVNCEAAQGYFFERPMSLDKFSEQYIKAN